jgi:hypothetical protein
MRPGELEAGWVVVPATQKRCHYLLMNAVEAPDADAVGTSICGDDD